MAQKSFYSKFLIFLQKPANFWKLIFVITFIKLVYIYFIPITPQEAYYWYYSKHPALSYFDHPPMAAYSIWIGTHLFGDIVFGVKFLGVIWGFLTSVVLYYTLKEALLLIDIDTPGMKEQVPLLGVILYNLTIFSHLYSVTIMPDTPLIFFWMLTTYFVIKIKNTGKQWYWLLGGISTGLGLLSKYTMVAILPGIFLAVLLDKDLRRSLLSPYPYLGVVLAFIVFLPVLIWNSQHDWASFAFQFSRRAGKVRKFRLKYFQQLLASQLFLLTPFLFILFIGLHKKIITKWKHLKLGRILFLTGVPLIFTFLLYSFFSLVKMNWLLPGYMGWIAASAVVFYYLFYLRTRWVKVGLYSSLWLILLAYLLLLIPNIPLGEGNTWSGWEEVSQHVYELQKKYGGPQRVFIFANSYKAASLLKFYLPDKTQEIYAQNIYKQPALQFDIWGVPDSLKGKNALYIFDDRKEYKNDLDKISTFFYQMVPLRKYDFSFLGKYHTRTIYVYLMKGYNPNAR